jgi:uncharacterized protein (UPF0332 family)
MTTINRNEIDGYIRQSQNFLARSRTCLANGDLHQASEKAWGAAAHMAKAVANGWRYETHADFNKVVNNARNKTGDDHLWTLRAMANDLHSNFYLRDEFLEPEPINAGIDQVEDLFSRLIPLTT